MFKRVLPLSYNSKDHISIRYAVRIAHTNLLVPQAANGKWQMLWQEKLNTRLNTQAKAEHSNTVHANPCQASVILKTCSSGLFSLLPILSNKF